MNKSHAIPVNIGYLLRNGDHEILTMERRLSIFLFSEKPMLETDRNSKPKRKLITEMTRSEQRSAVSEVLRELAEYYRRTETKEEVREVRTILGRSRLLR